MENDVVIEDIFERSTTAQSSVADENIYDEEDEVSEGSTADKSGHVVKHEFSQDESSPEAELDPKIRKGLERIRKLDAILADKIKVNFNFQFDQCLLDNNIDHFAQLPIDYWFNVYLYLFIAPGSSFISPP